MTNSRKKNQPQIIFHH